MDDFIIGEIDEKTLTVITVRKPYHILKMLSKSFGHECRQSYQLVFLCWSLEGIVDFSPIPQAERRVPMKQSLKFPIKGRPGAYSLMGGNQIIWSLSQNHLAR
jgi:hypothetical protein